MNPIYAAILVCVLSALAEWIHLRRQRVAVRLSFGPEGRAYNWTRFAPLLRCLAITAFTWGLAVMWEVQQSAGDGSPRQTKEPMRLVFVADLSPSMFLKDAGPDAKSTRQARMREEVEKVLMRVGGELRYGVIGFYTDAHTVINDAQDPELVRNAFDGLPLHYIMKGGSTDLGTSMNAVVSLIEPLPKHSVMLMVFTDGDSIPLKPIRPRPQSIKDVFILGVGNTRKGTFIAGHHSRQDAEVLTQLARSLRGTYYDVNSKHLPTDALGDLVVRTALPQTGLNLEQLAKLAMAIGAAVLSLLPVALQYWGASWRVVDIGIKERERVLS